MNGFMYPMKGVRVHVPFVMYNASVCISHRGMAKLGQLFSIDSLITVSTWLVFMNTSL